MAEELDPKPGTDPADTPAPDAPDPNSPPPDEQEQPLEPGPVEELASKAGWVPKDQFRGDPETWKPAGEFLLVGKESVRSMSRELKGVRDQVTRIASASAQITADKIAERDAYWQSIQAKAVEEGDNATVERAHVERATLAQAAAQPAPGLPPETAEFMDRHKAWMGVDPLATMRAETLAEDLAKRGVQPAEQLRQVERAIRKEFPEHFPAPAKRPAGVDTARSRNAGGSSGKKGFADMPAESQAMAKDFLTRHGVPLEKTAASYWADMDKNERKVG